MEKLSTVIVDKRNLIFLLTIILLVFSAFSRNWVEVESDLTYYLPSDSETKQALEHHGRAVHRPMARPRSWWPTSHQRRGRRARAPRSRRSRACRCVDYDETTAHYNNLSALYSITFAYSEDDEACLDSLEAVKEYLVRLRSICRHRPWQHAAGDHRPRDQRHHGVCRHRHCHRAALHVRDLWRGAGADSDVRGRTCAESGHELPDGQDLVHFKLGHKHLAAWRCPSTTPSSSATDFKEEHRLLPLREAVIVSLSKSIPEIGASSLTTIGGLVAMLFMQFKLGPDMALCLIKSILLRAARRRSS